MSITRRFALAGAAGACASVLLRFPGEAAEFNYKLGTNTFPAHPETLRAQEAAAKIKDATSGRVEIAIFPNSILGTDTGMLSQLRQGALEMQIIANAQLMNVVPAVGICAINYTFADCKHAWTAVDGPLGAYVRANIAKADIYPLQCRMWENGFKQILGNKLIEQPDDLKSVKIGTAATPPTVAMFKALGAAPTPVGGGPAFYTALQTHVVDAVEVGLASIEAGHYYEVGKDLAITNHLWLGVNVVANPGAWQRLPPKIRDIIEQTFDAVGVAQRNDIANGETTIAEELKSKGVIVTRTDFDTFQSDVRKSGLFAQWRSQYGNDAWSLLEKGTGKDLT